MAKPKIQLPPATLVIDEVEDIRHYWGFLFRVYATSGDHPQRWDEMREFGPIPGMRFDPHSPPTGDHPGVGVMYTARSHVTAIAEVYQEEHVIDRAAKGNALVFWELTRKLELLDLTKFWPVRNKGAAAIQMGDKAHTPAWARAIQEQFGDKIDGLYHRSSVDNQPMITLFDRSRDSFPERPDFNELLTDPASDELILDAAEKLDYAVT